MTHVLWVVALCARIDETKAVPAPDRPPVVVSTRVDKAVATTGDVIRFDIEVDRAADVPAELPEVGDQIVGFRVVQFGTDAPKEVRGRVVATRWYRLRADLVGSYVLPAVRVPYGTEEAVASEIFVEVASVLPESGDATDIRDIKPLVRARASVPWVWICAGAGGLMAAVAAWWWWRRRPHVVAPPPAAHEVAYFALNGLRQTNFQDPEEVRRYYFAISEVIRGYVERRFAINATDLTTAEIMRRVQRERTFPQAAEPRLRAFLEHTDQVKFADHRPEEAEIGQTYDAALAFVEQTAA
jgi:hypothetical protein